MARQTCVSERDFDSGMLLRLAVDGRLGTLSELITSFFRFAVGFDH